MWAVWAVPIENISPGGIQEWAMPINSDILRAPAGAADWGSYCWTLTEAQGSFIFQKMCNCELQEMV